jgi:hypothetical protein
VGKGFRVWFEEGGWGVGVKMSWIALGFENNEKRKDKRERTK